MCPPDLAPTFSCHVPTGANGRKLGSKATGGVGAGPHASTRPSLRVTGHPHRIRVFSGRSSYSYEWRGSFANDEVNALHAEAFETRTYCDDEWNWNDLLEKHSLGWVIARDGTRLVGLVNVLWDGFAHAWIQDTMVAGTNRGQGIGTQMIEIVRTECQRTGCEWLHVDFDEGLGNFYFESCGFTPTAAGIIRLN